MLLILLVAYSVHMIRSIVNQIQALGIESQHISGGCTYLYHPVDVGVNCFIKIVMI
jgi:hypothetical protein